MEEENQKSEAIMNFFAITGADDPEIAMRYLENSNWDVTVASSLFMSEGGSENPIFPERKIMTQSRNPRINSPNTPSPRTPPNLNADRNPIAEAPPNNQRSPGIFSKIYTYAKGYISSWVYPQPGRAFNQYLQTLNTPYKLQTTELNFENLLKFADQRQKLIFLYVHYKETPDSYVTNVLCSRDAVKIMSKHYFFYGCIAESEDGAQILEKFSDNHPLFFALIEPETQTVIDRLGYLCERRELIKFMSQVIEPDEDSQAIQDRLIREQQEKEYKEAERLAKIRAEEDHIRKEKALKEKMEAEKLAREKEEEKAKKLEKIGEEPPQGPDTTQIVFRLPSGNKIERRFYTSTDIETLYSFLEVNNVTNVELVSGFPSIVLKTGTLESEGLTPRALIHVRTMSE